MTVSVSFAVVDKADAFSRARAFVVHRRRLAPLLSNWSVRFFSSSHRINQKLQGICTEGRPFVAGLEQGFDFVAS